jgi:carbamoyl-phosphate synthase large subunit
MNQKRLMVVGGGEWQVPIVRRAKAMGLFVINSNLYPDSPGFAHADLAFVADVTDRDKNLEFARLHRPDGIVTDQSDIAVPTVAYLCQELNLPGIGVEKAELFTNKHQMRRFLELNGYPTPSFRLCRSLEDAVTAAAGLGYPVVLKPPANQSSRGVFKVSTESELRDRHRETLAFAPGGAVLVEQFILGTELTVEGFKSAERHHTLAISRKKHYAHNPMVACELFYSPFDEGMDYGQLRRQHNALVEGMGLPFGITHAEYILSGGQFFLVEIAARGGGTKISSDIVPALSDVDVNEKLVRLSLGEPSGSIEPRRGGVQFAMLAFLNFEPGVVEAVLGVEAARATPGVLDVGTNFRPGDRIRPPDDDRARHAYFIAVGETARDLHATCERVRGLVNVRYSHE